MAGEYKSPCGCKIHIAQWTAKRKVVSQESCPLHKNAAATLAALRALYDAIPTGFGEDRALNEATKQAEKVLGVKQ